MDTVAGNRKMNNRRVTLLILLVSAATLPALGSKDAKNETSAQTVTARGLVRMIGSSPRTSLVLSGENREWHIDEKDRKKIMPFQQQVITIEGTEYYLDLTFANGRPAGRLYYLKNIKILDSSPKE